MWYIIIALIVWLVGAVVCYLKFNFGDNKVEKVYFSIIWPLLIPLYVIHLIRRAF